MAMDGMNTSLMTGVAVVRTRDTGTAGRAAAVTRRPYAGANSASIARVNRFVGIDGTERNGLLII